MKRGRKAEEASTLFALSRYFLRPRRPPPVVVAVGGLIGSGKSTFAAALGRSRGWPVVSSDATRKYLAGLEALAPGGLEIYAPESSRGVYREMLRRAETVLSSGRSVILDASFLRRGHRADDRSDRRDHRTTDHHRIRVESP